MPLLLPVLDGLRSAEPLLSLNMIYGTVDVVGVLFCSI